MEVSRPLSSRPHLLRSARSPEQGLGRHECMCVGVCVGGGVSSPFPSWHWNLMGMRQRRGLSAVWSSAGQVSGLAALAFPAPPQVGPTWCVPSTSLRCSLPTCSPWSPSCCSTCLTIALTRSAAPTVPSPRPLPSRVSPPPSSSPVIRCCPADTFRELR